MKQTVLKRFSWNRVDRIGVVASSLCALHCAVCAFIPAIFAGLGIGILLSPEVEWLLTLSAITFAGSAVILGWRLHRSVLVSGFLIVGIIGLLASRGIEMGSTHHEHHDEHHSYGAIIGIVAGMLLLCGHILNLQKGSKVHEECCD